MVVVKETFWKREKEREGGKGSPPNFSSLDGEN